MDIIGWPSLLIAGLVCLGLEFLVPTVGVFAAIGAVAVLGSLVLALGGTLAALIALVAVAVFYAGRKHNLPWGDLWHKLVLHDQTSTAQGYVSAVPQSDLVGKRGETVSELRPAGIINIDGNPVDVVSEGAYIEKGRQVEIIAVQGSRVLVRRI